MRCASPSARFSPLHVARLAAVCVAPLVAGCIPMVPFQRDDEVVTRVGVEEAQK